MRSESSSSLSVDELAAAVADRLRDVVAAPGLVDAEAAAGLLGVPKGWVMAEVRADRIPHVRLGKYVRFEVDELRAWWEERRQGPWRTGCKPVSLAPVVPMNAESAGAQGARGTAGGTK